MFVPTGWTDWELVFAACLWAWLALSLASLLAFAVAYGWFREPAHGRVAASAVKGAFAANDASAANDAGRPASHAAVSPAPASTPAAELATAS